MQQHPKNVVTCGLLVPTRSHKMHRNLDHTLKFRIPSELAAEFAQACADNDTTAAQVLRAAVRDYVAKMTQPQGDMLKTRQRAGK